MYPTCILSRGWNTSEYTQNTLRYTYPPQRDGSARRPRRTRKPNCDPCPAAAPRLRARLRLRRWRAHSQGAPQSSQFTVNAEPMGYSWHLCAVTACPRPSHAHAHSSHAGATRTPGGRIPDTPSHSLRPTNLHPASVTASARTISVKRLCRRCICMHGRLHLCC